MHYHLISSIHAPPRPSHPVATNPTVQIHTIHTKQSTNPVATNPPIQIQTRHTQQSTKILTPLDVGYDIIHALSSHLISSIHILDQVTLLPPTLQSRSTQHTHNNHLTYSHPLTLDMISSMHYYLISSIHAPPRPSHPVATNPPAQIHATQTQQSTKILTPIGVGYDTIHALSSHLIHPSTSLTKSPCWHQPPSPDPHNTHRTIS